MRIAFAALLLALAACQRAAETATGCDLSHQQEFTFTDAEAPDTILAQSIGPSCDKAIGLLVVRTAEGYPVWSWSAPLSHRFGEVFEAEEREHMQSFLEAWVRPEIATTSAAPGWETLSPGQTTLNQLTYEDVRARNLPMLCHFSGTARQTCVFWEPAAGGAGQLLERDVEGTE
ncbi:MAG TPA: hypothetical protein VEA80_10810 [Vitreimonas sp.]|uniref:hypothetical protein n=1 Tax=Vitreimonas sp. TaxID=3069702 RepID=UPI002D25531F|nr:hypothetical protein [Vitreimonas sp.]HYD87957.1 hypothetical protein [Vitreimonas sp.]